MSWSLLHHFHLESCFLASSYQHLAFFILCHLSANLTPSLLDGFIGKASTNHCPTSGIRIGVQDTGMIYEKWEFKEDIYGE